MIPSIHAIDNFHTVQRYQLLESQGRQPVYAIYRNTQLMILSSQCDDTIGRIWESLKGFFNACLRWLGLITIDPERIQQLIDAAEHYWGERAIRAGIKYDEPSEDPGPIRFEHQSAQECVKERNTLVTECATITVQKDTLQNQITQLKEVLSALPDRAQELEHINNQINKAKEELAKVRADVVQSDYKGQVGMLKQEVTRLSGRADRMSAPRSCPKCSTLVHSYYK